MFVVDDNVDDDVLDDVNIDVVVTSAAGARQSCLAQTQRRLVEGQQSYVEQFKLVPCNARLILSCTHQAAGVTGLLQIAVGNRQGLSGKMVLRRHAHQILTVGLNVGTGPVNRLLSKYLREVSG